MENLKTLINTRVVLQNVTNQAMEHITQDDSNMNGSFLSKKQARDALRTEYIDEKEILEKQIYKIMYSDDLKEHDSYEPYYDFHEDGEKDFVNVRMPEMYEDPWALTEYELQAAEILGNMKNKRRFEE